MPKNKQTWDNSTQLVADVKWSKNNHENALLNTGVPQEENDWVSPGIPVRWTTDSSFKKKANQTIITYSFMTTKSKLNYGDDRREIIKPYANFTKTQQKDIAKLFKQKSLVIVFVYLFWVATSPPDCTRIVIAHYSAITKCKTNRGDKSVK